MKTVRRLKDVNAIEQFGMLLSKAENEPHIKQALEKIGYNQPILDQGKEYLHQAKEKYKENIDLKDAFRYAQAEFAQKKAELDHYYKDHRIKAQLISIHDPSLKDILGIKGSYPAVMDKWIETVRQFYLAIEENKDIQATFLAIGQPPESFNSGLSLINEVEELRAKKMRAAGDMRLATAEKNEAFQSLHQWIRIFIKAARIALRDEPSYMASLEQHLS